MTRRCMICSRLQCHVYIIIECLKVLLNNTFQYLLFNLLKLSILFNQLRICCCLHVVVVFLTDWCHCRCHRHLLLLNDRIRNQICLLLLYLNVRWLLNNLFFFFNLNYFINWQLFIRFFFLKLLLLLLWYLLWYLFLIVKSLIPLHLYRLLPGKYFLCNAIIDLKIIIV